jgi:hypothetical protein
VLICLYRTPDAEAQQHRPRPRRPFGMLHAPTTRPSHARRAVGAGLCLVLGALVAGCGIVGELSSPIVPLEVWNTTHEPIFLIDEAGRRIDVPACGHADAQLMDVSLVKVRTEVGYVYGFGTRGPEKQFLVFVAADGESDLTTIPPVAIPPCQGVPNAQPGV